MWPNVSPAKVDLMSNSGGFVSTFRREWNIPQIPNGFADLYKDRNHGDAMRALCSLGVVGVEILVIMDKLDLWKKWKNDAKAQSQSASLLLVHPVSPGQQ